jgi:hypothetical protein
MHELIETYKPEFIAFLFFFSGFILKIVFDKKFLAFTELKTKGVQVDAEITKFTPAAGKVSAGYTYKFQNHLAQQFFGGFQEEDKNKYQPNEKIKVCYISSKPQINCAIEYYEQAFARLKTLKMISIAQMQIMPIVAYIILKFVVKI